MKLIPLAVCLCLVSLCASAHETESVDSLRVRESIVEDMVTTPGTISEETVESVEIIPEEAEHTDESENPNWWWNLLWKGKLDLKDPNVEYPKAVGLFVWVYNWADKAFNGTDPEYVRGTGKRWKVYLRNDNWIDTYHMRIASDDERMNMVMISEPTCNVGAYLQYMAVSVGYSLDFTNIIGNKPINYKKFEFAFTCQRFTGELFYTENHGGSYIRKFGNYKDGGLIKKYFDGVQMKSFGVDAYYFFNDKRYSQGAAYSFAKYQIKSAGSFMAGFSFSSQDISFDFNKLPDYLKPYLIGNLREGSFHYNDYCLMLGYGYNLVFAKRWLFNVTALPGIGVTHTLPDSFEGSAYQLGFTFMGKMGLVYNIGDIFAGVKLQGNGHLYATRGYSLFNPIFDLSLSAGVRF